MDRTQKKIGTRTPKSEKRKKQIGLKTSTQKDKRERSSKKQGARTRVDTSNAATLSALAHQKLLEKGSKITDQMAAKALAGNVGCARFLWQLSKECASPMRDTVKGNAASLALSWNNEPEWNGEVDERSAETTFGRREPEG
jgi:hypothetical protein